MEIMYIIMITVLQSDSEQQILSLQMKTKNTYYWSSEAKTRSTSKKQSNNFSLILKTISLSVDKAIGGW